MARRRKSRRAQPRPLRDLVPAAYPSREPAEVKAIRAFAWWEKAVPRRVAENARPVKIERGVLIVHTRSHVWANELVYLKQDLLERLQSVEPRSGVRDIRVRVGKMPPIPPPIEVVRPKPPVIPVEALPEELARALAAVGDDDVREALHDAASVGLARQQERKIRRDRDVSSAGGVLPPKAGAGTSHIAQEDD